MHGKKTDIFFKAITFSIIFRQLRISKLYEMDEKVVLVIYVK